MSPLLDRMPRFSNLLVWLLIGVFLGQGPALALAVCCGEDMAAKPMACCCASVSCTPATGSDGGPVIKKQPRSPQCRCVEEPAAPPTQAPVAPAELGGFELRGPDSPVGVLGQAEPVTGASSGLYTWPPGAATSTLSSIRTVTLLI